MTMPSGSPGSPTQYLESRVLTASPAELQSMLLDGALRFARKAQSLWDDEAQSGEAYQAVMRTLDILESATMGVAESNDPIAERLEEQYAFLFREFAAAHLNADRPRLDKAIELLAYERETWRMGCEKAKGESAAPAPNPAAARNDAPASPAAERRRPFVPPIDATLPTGGFSVQA